MPTMRNNISYWSRRLMLEHGTTIKHVLKSAAVLVLSLIHI